MSRWTHHDGDASLTVTCKGPAVTVLAVEGDEGDEPISVLLSPAKAREFAEWLCLYANEAEGWTSDPGPGVGTRARRLEKKG